MSAAASNPAIREVFAALPVLDIGKAVRPQRCFAGDVATFEFTIRNTGVLDVEAICLVDLLDERLEVVSTEGAAFEISHTGLGQLVVARLDGTLAPGRARTLTIAARFVDPSEAVSEDH